MASAEGRDVVCVSTLMRTTVQSQVSNRSSFISSEKKTPFESQCEQLSVCDSAVADAWRALKSPSLGESSLDGAVSGLSTTSPSEGLSAPGNLGDTPHFNTLAGGALGACNGKYSR